MKTLLVVIMIFLVVCEGYIPEFRKSKGRRNRFVEEDTYEEDYDDNSLEETEEDSAPRSERKMRASDHKPLYGYTKSYRRRDEREHGGKTRKPLYSDKKSRSKYQVYEKPHRSSKKEYVGRAQNYASEVRSRKHDHRSAPVYESTYPYPSPPAPYSSASPSTPYHKPTTVKAKCSHQLLVSCTPTVTRVPCGSHAAGPHTTPTPHAPLPAYHNIPSVGIHAPSTPVYTPPSYSPPVYGPPAHTPPQATYHQPLSQPKPQYLSHHQHTVQPQPEPVHQPFYHKPGQHPYYQTPKPMSHYPAPPAYHQPYQPTYKSMEPTPSFAAPVSEDNQEPPHHPVISAFQPIGTSTTTQNVPTVPFDWDQKSQSGDGLTSRPAPADDDTQNQGEATVDVPESNRRVASPAATTSSPTSTTTAQPPPSSTTATESEDYAQR